MNDLAHIVAIYRSIKNPVQVDGTTEAYLDIQDEPMRSFVLNAEDESVSDDVGLALLSEPEEVQVGGSVHIKLFQPRVLPVFSNLAAFLGNGFRLLEPIDEFYIVDVDWSSKDDAPPSDAANLSALQQVLAQLSDSATVVDKDKRRLLFADSAGLVDLPINVTPDDLKAVPPKGAEEFVEFCTDALHRQHRLEAVANAVIRVTRGLAADSRLHHFLHNLSAVLSEAKSQHAVFMSAFSYEKVRDEVESLKVEYTTKIHKVLSEIQGQLLGIPAATVIVATQMKKTDVAGSEFIANFAVLLGAWIFGVFLVLLLRNQGHTLEVIKTEVSRQKKQLSTELPNVAARFDDVFSMLEKRIRHQYHILWAVDSVVVIGLVLSCYAFWNFSAAPIKAIFAG